MVLNEFTCIYPYSPAIVIVLQNVVSALETFSCVMMLQSFSYLATFYGFVDIDYSIHS